MAQLNSLLVTGDSKFLNTINGSITGNAGTVNNHTVAKDVPSNAVFTDTTYSLGNSGQSVTLTPSSGTAQSVQLQTLINGLTEGSSPANIEDYLVAQYAGGGTTTTSYHRRKVKDVVNATVVKNALGTGSGTSKYLREDGTWQTPPTSSLPSVTSSDNGKVLSVVSGAWAKDNIKLKTQTASSWSTANPVLASGEVGLDSTNRIMKVGDGSTYWNNAKGWNGMNDAYDTDSTGSAGRYNITAPGITELYDGLTIRVFLKKAYNSAFNTLNVNGLGEKLIRYRNATAMTSHATTNDIIELTYHTGFGAYNVSYTYCDPVNKANYRGNWASNTAYAVGDSVKYTTDGKYYICITAHTSSTSINTSNFKASTTPYSDLALPGVTNSVTDGWEFVRAYYSDTNYNYFDYNFRPYSGAYPIYRYKLCVLNKDNKLLPLTLTNQENTTNVIKDPLPDAFKPDQVWIYNTTTTTNANSVVPANILGRGFQHTTCTYTFNTTISSYRMIYLKGTYDNTTGLFSLYINPSATNKDSWYVQVPTNSNNITLSSYFTSGYYYICLGGTYSSNNNLQLFASTVMYYFDGTNLVPYAYKKDIITGSGQGFVPYTRADQDVVQNINLGIIPSSQQYINWYDLNNGGTIDPIDLLYIKRDLTGVSTARDEASSSGFTLPTATVNYSLNADGLRFSTTQYGRDYLAEYTPSRVTVDSALIKNFTYDSNFWGTPIFNAGLTSSDVIKTNINPTDATGYGIAPSCCVFGGTVAEFTTWAKSCNAVMGSVSISADYTIAHTTLPLGWYHFLWIPHRHGGTDSDNSNYGFCILKDFWSSTVYELSYTNGSVIKLIKRGCGETIPITSADSHVVIDEGGYVQEGRIVTVTVRVHGSADSSTRYYFANLPTPIAPLGVTATSYTTGKPANVGYYYLGVDGRLSNTGTVYKNEAHCINFSYVCDI